MRKFELEANMSITVSVPDEFLLTMREAANAEDSSVFLRAAQEKFSIEDDEFLLMILRNGLKRHIRDSVIELLQASGIGGTFSPVRLTDVTE